MAQRGLAAVLDGLVAPLAHPDATRAGAFGPGEAASLARGAQMLLLHIQSEESSTEKQAQIDQLVSVAGGAVGRMEPLLRHLAARFSCQRPQEVQQAELSLLLAASELLQACQEIAASGAMPRHSHLGIARAACCCFLSCSRRLVELAAAAARGGSGPAALGDLVVVSNSLLDLACCSISAVQDLQSSAAELAAPGDLTACLAAAAELAQLLCGTGAAGDAQRTACCSVARTLCTLVQFPPWQWHARDAALHASLPFATTAAMLAYLRMLAVGLRLPPDSRPLGCSWEAASHMAGVLASSICAPGLRAWACAASGASTAATMVAAAQLVQLLPVDVPLCQNEVLVVGCLGTLCVRLCSDTSLLARQTSEQQRRVAAKLLPAVGQLPQRLQLVAGSSQLGGLNERQLADMEFFCSSAKSQVAVLCRYAGDSPSTDAALASTAADCIAWASTAAALLRGLPLLHQLHGELQRHPQWAADVNAAADLAEMVCELLPRTAMLVSWQARPGAEACEQLQAVWALHTEMCRCVQRVAAASSPDALLAGQPALQYSGTVLSACMCAASNLFSPVWASTGHDATATPDAAAQAFRQVHAMSMAHWHALQAWDAHYQLADENQHTPLLLPSLAAMMGGGPLALPLDPAVQQTFERLWRGVLQDQFQARVKLVLVHAIPGPGLAAFLANSGYLDAFLEEAASVPVSQKDQIRFKLEELFYALYDAARPLAATQEPESSGDAALLERLRQCLAGFRLPADRPRLELSAMQLIRPRMRQLAAALLDWWRRPSAQQEQQLEAAQAAAARSCAYLGCANLGGSGGPAAGQGEGSMRCSACRAVWYCGTACSHADWRAGHRRMCKLLGAARAAEKAARRQAAEEAGAAAQQEG